MFLYVSPWMLHPPDTASWDTQATHKLSSTQEERILLSSEIWPCVVWLAIHRSFGCNYYPHISVHHEDGDSRFLRNFNTLLPYCTVSHTDTEFSPITAVKTADIRRQKSQISGNGCVSYVVTLEEWIFVVKSVLFLVRVWSTFDNILCCQCMMLDYSEIWMCKVFVRETNVLPA